jgi:hypothetical protein
MRFAKPILMAAVAVALVAYATDCSVMSTPEQAMQCCESMACAPGSQQAQDCCRTMPEMHASFVQPSPVHGVSFTNVIFAVLPVSIESLGSDSSARFVTAQSHAPPIFSLAAPQPLRI